MSDPQGSPPPSPAPSVLGRIPPVLLWTGVLLAVTSAFPLPDLVDVATGQSPTDARLTLPVLYVVFSPVARLLDAITLLGVEQHLLFIVTLLALGASIVGRRGRGPVRRALWSLAGVAAGLGAALGLYALMALVPRPMPRLTLDQQDDVAVNFHAHTRHSHDVRDPYTAAWAHDWHVRAGFDAYVLADHSSWAGYVDGQVEGVSPARAGDGVSALSGVEVWVGSEHVIALGDSTRYAHLFDPERRRFLPELLRGDEPMATLITTIPGDPLGLDPWSGGNPLGVVGVEVHDAAPRGLDQGRAQRDTILAFAEEHDLALISGSNNHGAGQTATAWTVLEIPGWEALAPSSLLSEVERTLHERGWTGTRVLERPAPRGGNTLLHVLVLPSVVLHMARSLTIPERLVWLLYLLGFWLVSSLSVRRQR